MDYDEYVQRISFRLLNPETPPPAGFDALSRIAGRSGICLDVWMTSLPVGQRSMQRRLRPLCLQRRRPTFAVGALINQGVAQMPAGSSFLALGIGGGFSLLAGMAGHRDRPCIGVGRFPPRSKRREAFLRRFWRWKGPHHEFHELPPGDYLTRVHRGAIGYCACAGRRSAPEQLALLRALEPHLASRGCLLIGDANSLQVRAAVYEFLSDHPHRFRLLLDAMTPRSGYPTFGNGVMLLRRCDAPAAAAFSPFPRRRAA